jgi:tetratricopeptide (TPR) repeat protein
MQRFRPHIRLSDIAAGALVLAGAVVFSPAQVSPVWFSSVMFSYGAHASGATAPQDTAANGEKSSVFGAYLSGQHALQINDIRSASRFFDQVLRRAPDNPNLMRRAFMLRVEDGRIADALDLAPSLVDDNGGASAVARLTLIIDATKRGDHETALALIDALPDTRLNGILQPLLGAWSAFGAGDRTEAAARLSELSGREGFETFLGLHAALLAEAGGEPQQAAAAFTSLLRQSENPSQRLMLSAARQLARAGDLDTALGLVDQFAPPGADRIAIIDNLTGIAQGVDDPSKPTPARGMAEALFDLASALQRERGAETAMMFTRLAIALSPNFDLAILLASEIHNDRGRYEEALKLAQATPETSPFYAMAQLRAAGSLEDLDRSEEAVTLLKTFAEARPDLSAPLVRLGDLERRREAWIDAIAAYDGALARLEAQGIEDWGVHYTRGIALERSKQWAEGEASFLKALELRPDQPFVLNYLGYSWVDRGENLNRAMEMIARAVELRPRDGYIVDSLGWAFYRLGQFEDAVRELERAVELRPTDPTINDHLGDAYWRVGRLREARFQWSRSLTFDPDAELAAKIERKLNTGLVDAEESSTGADKG